MLMLLLLLLLPSPLSPPPPPPATDGWDGSRYLMDAKRDKTKRGGELERLEQSARESTLSLPSIASRSQCPLDQIRGRAAVP